MRIILAIVPEPAFRRLRMTLPAMFLLKAVAPAEAEQALGVAPASLIVDPCGLLEDAYSAVIRACARAGTPVIVYTTLTSLACKRVLEASHVLTAEVVLTPTDDEDELIRRLVARFGDPSVPARMLHGLVHVLTGLQPRLQLAVLSLFCWGGLPDSVSQFASSVGADPTQVRRSLHRAGIRGAKRLLSVVRLARTWDALAASPAKGSQGGKQHGFLSRRTFNSSFRSLIGHAPRSVLHAVSSSQIAERLTRVMTEPAAGPHNDV